MNKKSKVISIFNLILSIGAMAFFGYFAYFLSALLSITFQMADTDAERINVIMRIVVLCLPAFLSLINLVMSCVSFKYFGRGEEKYSRRFHVAMFIIEIVAFISYMIYAVVNEISGFLFIASLVVAVIYLIFALFHIFDFKKSKKSANPVQDVQE